jgi:uncharacterized protein YggL (DUF469 family)
VNFSIFMLMQAVKQIVETNKAAYASNLAEQNISEKETIDWIDNAISEWWDDLVEYENNYRFRGSALGCVP